LGLMKSVLLAVVELEGWSGFIAICGERKICHYPMLYISDIQGYGTNTEMVRLRDGK